MTVPTGETFERLWRLRKHGHSVEAQVRPKNDGVEVRFFYDGAITFERTCPNREDAVGEALVKRAELERSGWIAHW